MKSPNNKWSYLGIWLLQWNESKLDFWTNKDYFQINIRFLYWEVRIWDKVAKHNHLWSIASGY